MDQRNGEKNGDQVGGAHSRLSPPPSSTFPTTSPQHTAHQYDALVDGIVGRLSSSTSTATNHESNAFAEDYSNDEREPLLSSSSSLVYKRRRDKNTSRANSTATMGATKESTMSGPNDQTISSHHSVFIYLVTILSALGGFLFGYDTGIVSGAMIFIRDYFELTRIWEEIIVSATILAAWIFSMIAGYLTNVFGRKWVVVLASAIFTAGGFTMAFAQSKYVLLVGRFTVGSAIGLASMVIPVYIAEVAPVQIRGKLVTVNTCFITFGQFVASILAGVFSSDAVHGWRWMLGIASVPSIIQMVVFIFLPESPRWLIQKERYDEAYESLSKFRSNTSQRELDAEFDSIKENCIAAQRESENQNVGQILRTPSIRRALFVGCLLMIFQQLAGINTVMYYSATIIEMSGVYDKRLAVWLSALTASVNFVFSFVGILLVEKLGRRLLTLSSLGGVVIALLVLGVGFNLAEDHSPKIAFNTGNDSICSTVNTCGECVHAYKDTCGFCFLTSPNMLSSLANETTDIVLNNALAHQSFNGTCLAISPYNNLHSNNSLFCVNGTTTSMVWATNWCPSDYSWMTLAGLMLYLLFFAPGMGPMPWTINSEIYPLWARSFCYSTSTSFNWLFNLLVSLTFLTLTEALTNHGAYYLYASIAFIGWVMFFLFLPETKGKSLEEIEQIFKAPLMKLGRNKEVAHSSHAHNNSEESVNTTNTTLRA